MQVCSLALLIGCQGSVGVERGGADSHADTDVDTDADTGSGADTGADTDEEPDGPPAGLVLYTTGDDGDADGGLGGPLLLAMGGGPEVDTAFGVAFAELGAPGDVVVLRTSGSDGYNDYLYDEIGGVDSVQTLLLTSRALADDPWVAWRIRHAEVVWMAGGDQSKHVERWGAEMWAGTATAAAIRQVVDRGGLVGGTSAGAAVLGELVYTARVGSASSAEALADPYSADVTVEPGFLGLEGGVGLTQAALFDTHFAERDRMGRLTVFLARALQDGLHTAPVGLGLDERTALLVRMGGDGGAVGEVFGEGAVHVVVPSEVPERCEAGAPLEFSGLTTTALRAGGQVQLPSGATDGTAVPLSVQGGVVSPADPYRSGSAL